MFVRSRPNKSGTVSVQVIDKSRGNYTVLKSIGTGRTEFELSQLEEKAILFIREREGLTNTLFEDVDEIKLEKFVSLKQ